MDLRTALLDELKNVLNKKNSNSMKPTEIFNKDYNKNEKMKNTKKNNKKKNIVKKNIAKDVSKKNTEILKFEKGTIAEYSVNSKNNINLECSSNNMDLLCANIVFDYKDLLPKVQRKIDLRLKYSCILESDVIYLTGIFNQMRNFFYNQPLIINSDEKFLLGGIYIEYLQNRARKTKKFYIINFRCNNDVHLIKKVLDIAKCYKLICHVEKIFF